MTNKRTVETMIAHNVNKGIRADRSAINNSRNARAVSTSECIGVSQHVRKHGSNAVFSLRNNHHIAVVSVSANRGRPSADAMQHGFGSSTVVVFSRVLAGGKVSKVQNTTTLAELCNMGAKYIGTRSWLYGNG